MNLFTYGTLMFDDVWRHVVGRRNPSILGTLADHRTWKLAGQVFPAMTAAPGERVAGRIWRKLTEAELAQLDEFESPIYERVEVAPGLADGSRVRCWAYILKPDHRSMLVDERWDPAEFERRGLATYLL